MATSDHIADDELKPDQTEGFKVGEKKTIDEYHKLGTLVSALLQFASFSICFLNLP